MFLLLFLLMFTGASASTNTTTETFEESSGNGVILTRDVVVASTATVAVVYCYYDPASCASALTLLSGVYSTINSYCTGSPKARVVCKRGEMMLRNALYPPQNYFEDDSSSVYSVSTGTTQGHTCSGTSTC